MNLPDRIDYNIKKAENMIEVARYIHLATLNIINAKRWADFAGQKQMIIDFDNLVVQLKNVKNAIINSLGSVPVNLKIKIENIEKKL